MSLVLFKLLDVTLLLELQYSIMCFPEASTRADILQTLAPGPEGIGILRIFSAMQTLTPIPEQTGTLIILSTA